MKNALANRENIRFVIYQTLKTNYHFQMLLALKLAFRYFRTRRGSLARFTTLAAITGIAAGVASLIISNALAKGFADEMQNKILSNTSHIAVSLTGGGEISDWKEIVRNLTKIENVESAVPTTFTNSIVIGEQAVSYSVLIVKAQTSKTENGFVNISVGEKLAEKIGAKTGDEIELVTLENQSEPKRSKVFVADLLKTGIYDYDSAWINISPEDFAALNGQAEFSPTILSVSVADIYKTGETKQKLKEILGENFQVIDWQEANQPLFAALSLERKVSLVVISLIIFIAALNITTTLALLVNERRFDIAVLRTCGAKAKTLILIFLFEGLLIGVIGTFFGASLGLLVCTIGNHFKLVSLSEQVYSLSYIPFHVTLLNVFLICLTALLICLSATVYPAYRASRLKPLDNLRS